MRTAPVLDRQVATPTQVDRIRPRWWLELAILAAGYVLYSLVRDALPGDAPRAFAHGRAIQQLQGVLHIDWELPLNQFVAAHASLAQPMNYYYAALHFLVTPAVLVWLFAARPHVYRAARTVLAMTTLIALAGFYLYPTAPPRLLPQFGYVDTVARFHTWGSLADPTVAVHSNEYAAMPSLHVAWALWCGVAIYTCARRSWVRCLGILYPIATTVVVIGTANHFVLDALAGALVLFLATVAWRLTSRAWPRMSSRWTC